MAQQRVGRADGGKHGGCAVVAVLDIGTMGQPGHQAIAVGAMAARYGYSSGMLARLVEIWNVGQYITGQGDHNIPQIKTGGYWAEYGLNYYKNRQNLK